jgi:putative Mg2+ transporter-C (MgtC) family protein
MLSSTLTEQIIRLLLAAAMGAIIGLERDLTSKPAGIRTHMLVSLGSCVLTMIGIYEFPMDSARIAAAVVTGIGFLGAGAIIGGQDGVHGLTTAAGIWITAAVGLAVGAGSYVIAAVSTLLVVVILFMRIDMRPAP